MFISQLKMLPQRCQQALYLTSRHHFEFIETLKIRASFARDSARESTGRDGDSHEDSHGHYAPPLAGDERGSAGAVAGRQPVRAADCARPPEDHDPLIAGAEIVEGGIE